MEPRSKAVPVQGWNTITSWFGHTAHTRVWKHNSNILWEFVQDRSRWELWGKWRISFSSNFTGICWWYRLVFATKKTEVYPPVELCDLIIWSKIMELYFMVHAWFFSFYPSFCGCIVCLLGIKTNKYTALFVSQVQKRLNNHFIYIFFQLSLFQTL